jgi:peptide-methionine (S)-S-oxide reductase
MARVLELRYSIDQIAPFLEGKKANNPVAMTSMTRRRDTTAAKRRARVGDVVTVDLNLQAVDFVPDSLFDRSGSIAFVLGWGNYLPGLHELVEGCAVGDVVQNVPIDAGWGDRQDDLIFRVPTSKLGNVARTGPLKVGTSLHLRGGVEVHVTELHDNEVVLDANPPMAGASYSCSFTVQNIEPVPQHRTVYHATNDEESRIEVATFALGCFWGAELAFLRVQGVVGTKVGYSQGITRDPTYEKVCSGGTQHREAVMVVYDANVVSYAILLDVAMERLAVTTSSYDTYRMFEQDEDSRQYKHGVYYHNPEQQRLAHEFSESSNNRFGIELLMASTFYDAEEDHQKYLYKGGQSARKGAKETIRCFG